MPKNLEARDIEQLLAEADELIERIVSDVIKDMEEEHRFKFEKYVQNLNKIKSEVHGQVEKKETWDLSSSAHGIHEAIEDIVKATKDFKDYFFGSSSSAVK